MADRKNRNLYQDKASGVWYFQKKVRGVDKPYKFSLNTQSVVEARRKRDRYLKVIEAHGYIPKEEPETAPESVPFGEVAQRWAEIARPDLQETTFNGYRKVMNTHVLPVFGNKAVDAITALDIETFISRLKCGSKTKLNILTPFRLVMKFAKKHHFIQEDPFADVDPIRKTKNKEKRPLTLDEINRFLDAVDEYWRPLFVFLFFSGVRVGEATALKWKRVDFPNGIVKIRKAIVRGEGGKLIYKEPKTESSVRDVKLPGFVLDALREQRKRTWKGDGDNFVFQNKEGRPIHRHTLNQRVIKPTLEKIGVTTPISIKDTRASYITNALDKNERMSFVRQQVGHSSNRMIMDHYYRDTPAPDDGSKLENAWNSTRILPESDTADLDVPVMMDK